MIGEKLKSSDWKRYFGHLQVAKQKSHECHHSSSYVLINIKLHACNIGNVISTYDSYKSLIIVLLIKIT